MLQILTIFFNKGSDLDNKNLIKGFHQFFTFYFVEKGEAIDEINPNHIFSNFFIRNPIVVPWIL
jgi:hypothetical protein